MWPQRHAHVHFFLQKTVIGKLCGMFKRIHSYVLNREVALGFALNIFIDISPSLVLANHGINNSNPEVAMLT